MKIALVSLYGVENTGIRSISSALKEHGFETYIIFFKKWVNNDVRYPEEKEIKLLIKLLKELDIGLVGFGFTSPFLKIAQELTGRIKNELIVSVVWGGIHATVKPEESLDYCDMVCRGEAEEAVVELADSLKSGKAIDDIRNICFKRKGSNVLSNMRPLIDDLDLLPDLDYGGDDKFFIEGNLKRIDPMMYARELRVFASRGCPFNCSYCYNSIFRKLYKDTNYHRIRSPEEVVSSIKRTLSIFKNIRKIKFDDDSFVFPKKWINDFCEIYEESIGLPFEILYNAECLDEESLVRLKSAGLRKVQVGIQTGSLAESHEVYNRKLSLEKVTAFAHIAKKLRLNVVYDIIFDNPLADYKDNTGLVSFLLTLPRPFDLFVYSLTVFPGTRLSEILLDKNLIGPEDIEGNATKSFNQFRLSFSYPRSREELFMACITSLTSKSFLPKSLILLLIKCGFLKKHPLLLKLFATICNKIKLVYVFVKMVLRGEMNFWKFKEYGLPGRSLIQ